MYKGDKNKFGQTQLAELEKRKSRTYIKTPDEVKDNMGKGGDMAGLILYNSYCVACHQRDGKGDNNRYPPLLGSEWIAHSTDTLINIILNGLQKEITVNGKTYNGVMPAHGGFLDDHAVASIATYVKMKFNKEKINITSAEVNKIRMNAINKK